jgi:hypothetical protein
MAQTVNVTEADAYFATEVLYTEEWDNADLTIKEKALTEAERRLYRHFAKWYDLTDPEKMMPAEAIFEQALWMLRLESARTAETGVTQVGVSGLSITYKSKGPDYIAPEARRVINEDQGLPVGGRLSWTVL